MAKLSRSENMARIKSKDTSPEIILRKALWSRGFRYRIHSRTPIGKPDLVFPGKKVAVFIDGCFWHGCPLHYVRPRSRVAFWAGKLRENVERDCFQTRELEKLGWCVFRVWEHEVHTQLDEVIGRIYSGLEGQPLTDSDLRVFKVIALDEFENLERRYLLDLRDSHHIEMVEGKRHTTKWRVRK